VKVFQQYLIVMLGDELLQAEEFSQKFEALFK
jgi:hypothetical protein